MARIHGASRDAHPVCARSDEYRDFHGADSLGRADAAFSSFCVVRCSPPPFSFGCGFIPSAFLGCAFSPFRLVLLSPWVPASYIFFCNRHSTVDRMCTT